MKQKMKTPKKLIIFPTKTEAGMFLKKIKAKKTGENFYSAEENINVLISDPGAIASVMNITFHLSKNPDYDFILLAGLAGRYNRNAQLTDVICVEKEQFADLGVNNKGTFMPLYNLEEWSKVYSNGEIYNPNIDLMDKTGLKKMISNTVNLNNPELNNLPEADIENMEGAGFFLAAKKFKLPFLEIRALSNDTNNRDKRAWKIGSSLDRLTDFLLKFLK